MRYAGDLGFSSLVLLVVVCVVLPAIGFYIRRKWRIAGARKEEIRRLLILAAEETARAEREASYAYGGAAVPAAKSNQCAVCYVPATSRCAQCKSVRYWCVHLSFSSSFFPFFFFWFGSAARNNLFIKLIRVFFL